MTYPSQIQSFATSPAAFRDALQIDAGRGPVPFQPDDWQEADFRALDPAWSRLLGHQVECEHDAGFLERPRGHSKTHDNAVMAIWALVFSRRQLSGIAAAADRDQAKLIRDKIFQVTQNNPWLRNRLDVQQWRIRNPQTGSELEILSSDAPTSYGQTPDFVIADELCHWQNRDLWDSLISSAAKRERCVFVVITNAGLNQGTGWQWNVREAIRSDPDWYFSRLDGPQASWITESQLQKQERLLPPRVFARLWLNQWQTESGDALDMEDVEACITLDGPMPGRQPGFEFVGCLDLGLKNDHSALVVIGVDVPKQRLRLASCESWAPPVPGGQVNLQAVKSACIAAQSHFGLSGIIYDPWQAALMAQQLQSEGLNMVEWPFSAKNLDLMATTLLQVFKNRQIDLYRDPALIRDLSRLTIIERQSGFKLQATRDEHGHCDRATALAIGLPLALDWMKALPFQSGGEIVEEPWMDFV